jgi:cobyrinic acid a,c-diamide synthase
MIAFAAVETSSGVGRIAIVPVMIASFHGRGKLLQPFRCGADLLRTPNDPRCSVRVYLNGGHPEPSKRANPIEHVLQESITKESML